MAIQILRRPYEYSWSGNPVHYRLFSQNAADDSSIFFEVKILFKKITDGVYAEIITLPYFPVAGIADINIQDVLDSKLEFNTPAFNVDERLETEAPGQTANYYIQFREIVVVDSDPTWDDSESYFNRNILKGGIDYFKWRGNNFWINYYDSQMPFLTWQKSNRLASLTERMYLLWFNKTNASALKTHINIVYTDASVQQLDKALTVHKNNVVFIPAGATQWSLPDEHPDRKIYYWNLQVIDNADQPVSELFTYYADNRNDYNDITLNYRGSLGGLDSVRIRGIIEHDLNYEFEEQDKTFEPDYFDGDVIDGKRVINNSKERKIYKGDIGYLKKEDQDRFRDSHLRRDMWWERNKKWWPVIVLTPSQKQKTSEDHLWSFPIQFTLGSDGDNYYTPDTIDLGDGVFTSNVCLARLGNIEIDIDISGADAAIVINATEIDPQDASTQFYYQILGVDADPILYDTFSLPILRNIPKGIVYIVEFRCICGPNDIPGNKTSAQIDTTEEGGGGGGGGTHECFLGNGTNTASNYTIKIDDIERDNGFVGELGVDSFFLLDYVNVKLTVIFDSIEWPSSASMTSNGNTYTGSIVHNQVFFFNVDITNGCEINIS